MRSRPRPEKRGLRIPSSRSDAAVLLEAADDEPCRHVALWLGLRGLRTHELLQSEPRHVRALENGAEGRVLIVAGGKTGTRGVPLTTDPVRRTRYLKSAVRIALDQ